MTYLKNQRSSPQAGGYGGHGGSGGRGGSGGSGGSGLMRLIRACESGLGASAPLFVSLLQDLLQVCVCVCVCVFPHHSY